MSSTNLIEHASSTGGASKSRGSLRAELVIGSATFLLALGLPMLVGPFLVVEAIRFQRLNKWVRIVMGLVGAYGVLLLLLGG
jgi:hypothetical protein